MTAVERAIRKERRRCAAVCRGYPRPPPGVYDPRHHVALELAALIESGRDRLPTWPDDTDPTP